MPRQVNAAARRQRIADAVCRLAARDGLEGVSVRHVAAEAGVSIGQVQHYFRTKDEMLLFASNTVRERAEQRVRRSVAALESRSELTAREGLRTLLTAMIPGDEESRFEAPLQVAFAARAVVRPALAEPLRDSLADLVGYMTSLLVSARERGEIPGDADPEREAMVLLALADGLVVRVLLDPGLTTAAVAALDYHLDRVFAGGPPTPTGQ
jgi:AcrR family transcriptional regulator